MDELIAATGGRLLREGGTVRFGDVVTDSTHAKRDSVFIALKGARLDGHRFVGAAVKNGARCVIVDRAIAKPISGPAAVVCVGDTLKALGDLGHFRRRQLAPRVFAITGSNGKTTTKEMLAAILEEASIAGQPWRGRVLKTAGNFNNLVGLPLTLLRLRPRHRAAVVELGTNQPGEIQRLTQIADPDFALITCVGRAHLEGLKSLAGVAREKGAIFRFSKPTTTIAVNHDDFRVKKLAESFSGKKITFGQSGIVRAASARLQRGVGTTIDLRIGGQKKAVQLHYLGNHNIANAAAAAALAHAAGVSVAAIKRGLERAKPFSMRMEVGAWRGVKVINDAYNANPGSMRAALETLAQAAQQRGKLAALGDMFELGEHAKREHYRLGLAAARCNLDGLFLLGAWAKEVRRGALKGRLPAERVVIASSHEEIARSISAIAKKGDWLLVKGSRGMKMERILSSLRKPSGRA